MTETHWENIPLYEPGDKAMLTDAYNRGMQLIDMRLHHLSNEIELLRQRVENLERPK